MIIADAAQVVGNKLFIMGGGWDKLGVDSFPKNHSMGIALAIRVPWNETNERHGFEVEIVSDDGETQQKLGGTFEAGRAPGTTPGQHQRVQFAFNAIMTLGGPGTFVVLARIDGEEQQRVAFNVIGGAQPAIPPGPSG